MKGNSDKAYRVEELRDLSDGSTVTGWSAKDEAIVFLQIFCASFWDVLVTRWCMHHAPDLFGEGYNERLQSDYCPTCNYRETHFQGSEEHHRLLRFP
jgi:hypothetical protein